MKNPKRSQLVMLAAAVVASIGIGLGPDKLAGRQTNLQRKAGHAKLNEQLYAYDASEGISGGIATDYLCMKWLPGLCSHYCACSVTNLDAFRQVYERDDVQFAMVHENNTSTDVWAYLRQLESEGKSCLVLEKQQYCFFKKNRVR